MTEVVCFTCGLPVGEPHFVNVLEDGEPCPTCMARALDAVPPALPSRRSETPALDPDPVPESAEDSPSAS